jgi:hypothetical protein
MIQSLPPKGERKNLVGIKKKACLKLRAGCGTVRISSLSEFSCQVASMSDFVGCSG